MAEITKPEVSTTAPASRAFARVIEGVVVSDKMDKTRVIAVNRTIRHGLYGKSLQRRRKFFIHDEKNASKVGDVVQAIAVRAISRHKNFRLLKVLGARG